jgi:hypothetical protein
MKLKFGHQAEVLSRARRCLMPPHSSGIDAAISEAFRECALAFHLMDESALDDNASGWVAKIKALMVIAHSLSTDEQLELSRTVDELADWFAREEWDKQAQSGLRHR